jgi:hypothetical protein
MFDYFVGVSLGMSCILPARRVVPMFRTSAWALHSLKRSEHLWQIRSELPRFSQEMILETFPTRPESESTAIKSRQ